MTVKFNLSFALIIGLLTHSFSQLTLSQKLPDDVLMVINFNLDKINNNVDIERIKQLEMIDFAYTMSKKSAGEDRKYRCCEWQRNKTKSTQCTV